MVGEHRVIGHLRGEQVGVHRAGGRIGAQRHDAIEPPPHAQDAALPLVVGQERLAGLRAPGLVLLGQCREFLAREDRMRWKRIPAAS